MIVSLTPELARLVEEQVASGRYTSASEVVREALRLLADKDRLRETRVSAVRQQVARGLGSARAGRFEDGDAVIAKLNARLTLLESHRRGT
jgi:antitoxin ParD1/3/4